MGGAARRPKRTGSSAPRSRRRSRARSPWASTKKEGAAATVKKVLETATPYLKAGEIGAKVAPDRRDPQSPDDASAAEGAEAGQGRRRLIATASTCSATSVAENVAATDGGEEVRCAPRAAALTPEAARRRRRPEARRTSTWTWWSPRPRLRCARCGSRTSSPTCGPSPSRPRPRRSCIRRWTSRSRASTPRSAREQRAAARTGADLRDRAGPATGARHRPLPVPESNVSPERLREEFGMPEGGQEKFARDR